FCNGNILQTWNYLKGITNSSNIYRVIPYVTLEILSSQRSEYYSQWCILSGQRTFDGCIRMRPEFASEIPEAYDLLDFREL
ncbi:21508_t:CDS:2, partial [Dentiscutata erythropus]